MYVDIYVNVDMYVTLKCNVCEKKNQINDNDLLDYSV